MKYGQPEFGFLRWHWRAAQCELPRFDAAAFFDAVRGRSMAFVGDSLARNHMQSLSCLFVQGIKVPAVQITQTGSSANEPNNTSIRVGEPDSYESKNKRPRLVSYLSLL